MGKLYARVYVLQVYICKILQKNVSLDVIQAMHSLPLDFVWLDVLVIHKHLHMLILKNVYLNVNLQHKIFTQIILLIFV